jgi:shikimate dehydrogenase
LSRLRAAHSAGAGPRVINGRTELIVHLGYPTETFTAPMIYNPWFASRGINAVVVPMGVQSALFAHCFA